MGQAAASRSDLRLRKADDDFPGWRVWQSDTGRWWATRTGTAAQWGDEGAVPMTVDADSETQLRQVLEGYRDAA